MPLVQILKAHPFTKGMPEVLVKKLVPLARQVEFEEDQIVFQAGERSMNFCLLLRGSACVEIRTDYYAICVQNLGPGDAFGWSSLVEEEHHTVFQVRARDASSAIFLDGEKLRAACFKDPKLGFEIFRRLAPIVARRVRATEFRLAEFCGSAKARNGHEMSPAD